MSAGSRFFHSARLLSSGGIIPRSPRRSVHLVCSSMEHLDRAILDSGADTVVVDFRGGPPRDPLLRNSAAEVERNLNEHRARFGWFLKNVLKKFDEGFLSLLRRQENPPGISKGAKAEPEHQLEERIFLGARVHRPELLIWVDGKNFGNPAFLEEWSSCGLDGFVVEGERLVSAADLHAAPVEVLVDEWGQLLSTFKSFKQISVFPVLRLPSSSSSSSRAEVRARLEEWKRAVHWFRSQSDVAGIVVAPAQQDQRNAAIKQAKALVELCTDFFPQEASSEAASSPAPLILGPFPKLSPDDFRAVLTPLSSQELEENSISGVVTCSIPQLQIAHDILEKRDIVAKLSTRNQVLQQAVIHSLVFALEAIPPDKRAAAPEFVYYKRLKKLAKRLSRLTIDVGADRGGTRTDGVTTTESSGGTASTGGTSVGGSRNSSAAVDAMVGRMTKAVYLTPAQIKRRKNWYLQHKSTPKRFVEVGWVSDDTAEGGVEMTPETEKITTEELDNSVLGEGGREEGGVVRSGAVVSSSRDGQNVGSVVDAEEKPGTGGDGSSSD